jgi:hypothetical protein
MWANGLNLLESLSTIFTQKSAQLCELPNGALGYHAIQLHDLPAPP